MTQGQLDLEITSCFEVNMVGSVRSPYPTSTSRLTFILPWKKASIITYPIFRANHDTIIVGFPFSWPVMTQGQLDLEITSSFEVYVVGSIKSPYPMSTHRIAFILP